MAIKKLPSSILTFSISITILYLMDNKAKILKSALELFSSKGYDAVSVQEIAKSSGITKPTLYYYFGSKQGLLKELFKEFFETLYDNTSNIVITNDNLHDNFRKVVKCYLNFARKNSDFYRMQLAMSFSPPESIAIKTILPFLEKQNQEIEYIFVKIFNSKKAVVADYQSLIVILIGIINSYIFLYLNNDIELDNSITDKIVSHFVCVSCNLF